MAIGQILRVALLGASHWHVPLYLAALERPDVQVVAVSDADPAACARVAARFGAACYTTDTDLLAPETIDFAFVFGEHVDMPDRAARLIAARIPFAIEKPCGLNGGAVMHLAEIAGDLFVAVPFIFRLGDLYQKMTELEGGLPAAYDHLGFRFLAGPAARYRTFGCDWMLNPARSGGGCAINLALHFIDLFHCLTGQTITGVAARMRAGTPGIAVEDHAALLLTASDGTIGTIETSYTYPATDTDLRELSFSLSSKKVFVHTTPAGIRIRRRGETQADLITMATAPDPAYGDFVTRTIADLRAGRPPVAGLADAARAMRVLDAAYRSAREGGGAVMVAN